MNGLLCGLVVCCVLSDANRFGCGYESAMVVIEVEGKKKARSGGRARGRGRGGGRDVLMSQISC